MALANPASGPSGSLVFQIDTLLCDPRHCRTASYDVHICLRSFGAWRRHRTDACHRGTAQLKASSVAGQRRAASMPSRLDASAPDPASGQIPESLTDRHVFKPVKDSSPPMLCGAETGSQGAQALT